MLAAADQASCEPICEALTYTLMFILSTPLEHRVMNHTKSVKCNKTNLTQKV